MGGFTCNTGYYKGIVIRGLGFRGSGGKGIVIMGLSFQGLAGVLYRFL